MVGITKCLMGSTRVSSRLEFSIQIADSIDHLAELEMEFQAIYLDPPYDLSRTHRYSAVLDGPEFKDTWDGDEYSIWLDRLVTACKSVLAKDGTLFLHMSAEQSLVPEMILYKHFSKVEKIFWQKAHGKNTVKNKCGAVVDIIFMASSNKRKFNLVYIPLDGYYFENSYKQKDERGFYALGAIKHDKTRKGHFYTVTHPDTGETYDVPYGWRFPEEEMQRMISEDRIHFPKLKGATLYKKLYKHESKGKPLSNLWDDVHYITRTDQDQRFYPTQKPFKLLRRIIAISTDPGDWVLDPVAGSGTTGAAALSLGRNAYMIDINKDAEPIIQERLGKARDDGIIPIEDDVNNDNSKKKSKKSKKAKSDPNQSTLSGFTADSGTSGSSDSEEPSKEMTSDESDADEQPSS